MVTGNLQTGFQEVQTFARPHGIPEALELMRRFGGEARFVEGGTDLTTHADRSIHCLVDLSLAGLNYIRPRDGGLVIGATTRLAQLERSPEVRALAEGLLAKAAAGSGSVQVRHRATIGGKLAAAGAPPHILTALLALDATAVMATPSGGRRFSLVTQAAAFREALDNGELLMRIVIPAAHSGEDTGWLYRKLFAPVAVGMQLSAEGEVKMARLAIGGGRALRAESRLQGQSLTQELAEQAANDAIREWNPQHEALVSAVYCRDAAQFMIERVLQECAQKAGWVL
jgi:carbon-monoxide dehydrogenase medium subunit